MDKEKLLIKSTKGKMLARLDDWYDFYIHELNCSEQDYKHYHDQAYEAIRALIEEHGKLKEENIVLLERIENLKHGLIEHGPEVSREFVGRWAMLFRQDEISVNKTGHHLDWEKYIEHLLCEAGVTVRED